MADEHEPSGPSLEPPRLFRRKKAKPAPTPPTPPTAPPGDDSPTTILDDTGTDTGIAAAPTAPAAPPAAPPASRPTEWSSPAAPDSQTVSLDAPSAAPTSPTAPAAPPRPPRPPKRPRTGPLLPGRLAAALTGLLVGGLVVGLTSASFELCSRIQGTNSCGGPGIFLLLAILVLAVVLGTVVLRLCEVPEPGSTSFLAVGLTSVVALLFLIDALFEWWMIIVIPLVSVATFLLSHWVTATFVEPARD
ncbi:hypothetical protein [Nocardioides dilutus]